MYLGGQKINLIINPTTNFPAEVVMEIMDHVESGQRFLLYEGSDFIMLDPGIFVAVDHNGNAFEYKDKEAFIFQLKLFLLGYSKFKSWPRQQIEGKQKYIGPG